MSSGINFNIHEPFYKQVENDIKSKIINGVLKPGDLIHSHKELAKYYGVSLITIKKALYDLIKEGYLFSRVGKGTYVATFTAQRNNKTQTKNIGVVLRDLKHPYFASILTFIEQRINELGFHLILASSNDNNQDEEKQINRLLKMGVDGIIIASLSLQYRATTNIKKLHEDKFPYVMISYIHEPEFWYVGSDHEYGGYIATEHFIKFGYKKIGYVHAGYGNLLADIRKNGYARALMEYNIPYKEDYIFYVEGELFLKLLNDRYQQGLVLGNKIAELKDRPEALFIYSDLLALGIENALLEKGLKVPDDIALIGFDGIEASAYAPVPLTTVKQQIEKIGTTVVDVLHKRINGEDVSNRIIFKPFLLIRDSCGVKKNISSKIVNQ